MFSCNHSGGLPPRDSPHTIVHRLLGYVSPDLSLPLNDTRTRAQSFRSPSNRGPQTGPSSPDVPGPGNSSDTRDRGPATGSLRDRPGLLRPKRPGTQEKSPVERTFGDTRRGVGCRTPTRPVPSRDFGDPYGHRHVATVTDRWGRWVVGREGRKNNFLDQLCPTV